MCTTGDRFVLSHDSKEDLGCDLANALLLNLSMSPSLIDSTAPPSQTNDPNLTPSDYLASTDSSQLKISNDLNCKDYSPLPTHQQREPTATNTPNKDSQATSQQTGNTHESPASFSQESTSDESNSTVLTSSQPSNNTAGTTATACTSNLVPVGGGGDRHNQYKGSRIPPGVRPWLSRRLEELWGIDGQVYSHYILSVLLDGVDNEFFVDDSELQDLNRSRKGTKKGANDTREAASGEADSFEARRRAVLNYLSSFSVDEHEVFELVDELLYRLGFPGLNFCATTPQVAPTPKRVKEVGRKYTRSLGRGRSLSSNCVGNQSSFLKAERVCLPTRWTHSTFNEKRKEKSELASEMKGRKLTRPRFASLDECRYGMPMKHLSKSSFPTKISSRNTINEESNSGKLSKHLAYSFSSDSCVLQEDHCHANVLHPLRISSLFDLLSCVSTEPDEESCFDLDLTGLQLEDPDRDETYNEAFPALLGVGTQENPKTSVGHFIVQGPLAPNEGGKTLPPNPVSRGQPVWSTKVKAPIGRPLNRRYFDAQASSVITEEVSSVDEASQTVNNTKFSPKTDKDTEEEIVFQISEVGPIGPDVSKVSILKSANSRLTSNSEFELSILNMVGLTPEKFHEHRCGPKHEDYEVLARYETNVSKCLKDLFNNREQAACSADAESELFSPELSKIWEKELIEATGGLYERCNSTDGKESACGSSNGSDPKRRASGAFTSDSVWMPTEEELGRNANQGGLVSAMDNDGLPEEDQQSNSSHAYIGQAILCELFAGFPGMNKDNSQAFEVEAVAALVYDNDDEGDEEVASQGLLLGEKPSCHYYNNPRYNPRLYDLLDHYMLKEHLAFGHGKSNTYGIFGLGSFQKKRDMYFDEFFAENFEYACESPGALAMDDYGSILSEHVMVQIMNANEQQICTPVSSEFDGSLFDDRASEVTPNFQRPNSLILRHQIFNAYNNENVSTTNKPKMCDAAMQTDDNSDEEHRVTPDTNSVSNVSVKETSENQSSELLEKDQDRKLSNCSDTSQSGQFVVKQAENAPSADVLHETKSEVSQKDAIPLKSEGVTDLVKSFDCPAGCKHSEETSQSNVPEENLLISPKTHFRPISVQSIESECGYEEKLIIQQTVDGIPVPNTLQLTSDTKDSRLFSSWCQVSKSSQLSTNVCWQPPCELENTITNDNSLWKPGPNPDKDTDESAWKSGVLRDVNTDNVTCWNEQFPVFAANAGPLSGNNLDIEESPDQFEMPNFDDQNVQSDTLWWAGEADKNNATSDWLSLPTNQFANTTYEYTNPGYMSTVPSEDPGTAQVAATNNQPFEELEFVFDHEMASGSYEGVVHTQNPGFQSEYRVGFLPMETLEDVDCKCRSDLPGELGIDPLCQLHGGGAAIYLTTGALGDSNSVASGGDWSMGSNCSLSALPPTTAINPNVIGFQPPIGASRNKTKKKSVLAANSILPIDESLVSQKQKQKQKQRKKKKSVSNSSGGGGGAAGEKENKCADKPCSYFLEGACHRLDCKFSHDLGSIACRFFAEGACFKGCFCPFSHALPAATSTSVPVGTTLTGELIAVPVNQNTTSFAKENSTELKSCSFDSAAEILFVTKDHDMITSDSDSVAGTFGTPDVDIVTTLGKGPPKVCKRKRVRNGSKQGKQKPVPNITDKAEFPILPKEKDPIKCEANESAVQLSLKSIYPKEGFCSIKSEAVV